MRITTAGTSLMVAFSVAACPSTPAHSRGNGESCSADGDCESNHCSQGECVGCVTASDCDPGFVCSYPSRILGPSNTPSCIAADAGCASSPSRCPGGGFYCTACPDGYACNDSTGVCYSTTPTLPVCGSSNPVGLYDAGWGPGPNLNGATCFDCLGCPLGSECVCDVAGLAGVRCNNPGAAAACFLGGGVGTCQVFPGDCATNTQCTSTPATPLCSAYGNCVQCMEDADCSQDAGAQGCVSNKCGPCCRSDTDCPGDAPLCESGFCYVCQADAGCPTDAGLAGGDGGVSDGGLLPGDGG
jgi:hypothetical protein